LKRVAIYKNVVSIEGLIASTIQKQYLESVFKNSKMLPMLQSPMVILIVPCKTRKSCEGEKKPVT